ncbi:MAG: hypothetical protein WBC40_10075 [Halobacteriota archaeon]
MNSRYCAPVQEWVIACERKGKEEGFGLIPGKVARLPANVRVPHIGWNNLHLHRHSELLEGITDADYCLLRAFLLFRASR